MKNRLILSCFLAVLGCAAFSQSAEADRYCIGNLFDTFATDEERRNAVNTADATDETRIKEGAWWFLRAAMQPGEMKNRLPELRRAEEILGELWNRNRKNNRVSLLLAYVYCGIGGALPMTDLNALIACINKAQNLFSIVASRLPDNLDARLGRTRININLTPQTGRPDSIILDDVRTYLRGYEVLPAEQRENPYYRNGLEEIRLAGALVLSDQGKEREASELYRSVIPSRLPDNLKAVYESLGKRIKG